MHEKSISAIASTFPLTLRNGTLEVQDLKVVTRQFSPIDQYNALMREGTLQEAVKGTLVLKDKEGKVVDTAKNFTLVHVPHLTERHTLIMGGNEYQVANQLRRKPGVYTARADNGELRAIFNLGRGSNFNLGFTPDKGTFHVQLGTSNIPLYPVLRAAGVSHETIAHHLGDAVAKANQTYHGKEEERATGKLYAKLEHPALFNANLPHAEKVEAIRKKWDVTTLDPHVTEATLGTAYSKVTPEALLTAARKVLDVHGGHKATDDTDALTYKTFHSLDDFLHERIKLTARAWVPKAKLALATKGTIHEALRPAPFSDGVRKFITTGSLAAVPTAINPLELIDHAVKVTSLGEGGIPSDRAIPLDARMIHNTHFGALDPIRTPESSHSGVDIRATIAAHRDEAGNLYTVATNVKTKREEFLRAGDLRKYVVAFPGEELKGTVDAFKDGRVERVPASSVTHQISHTSHLYSPATTLLPLIHGMQGNRAIMASKMGTQALPLIEREAPFVQSKSHLPGEISFEAMYGHMIAPRAPVSGKVVKIEDGWIHIRPEGVKKTAEDRPTVKVREFGPFTFHVEIPKGTKPFGHPFPCDYGYLPGYVGPDGDSLDFWVGSDKGGAFVSVDTEEQNAKGVWVKRDTKYIVGVPSNAVHLVLTQIERKPKTRCVNRRDYASWDALTKSIAHFKDEDDQVEKTAATKDDGLVRVPYSQNFPFPSKTSLNHTLSVKPGDTVVAGQRMGDSNYTKDGVLALGRNLRVAYVPHYGLNSNDAVVISEACAKKLTSEHVYREVFSIPVGMEFSKERHQFYYGTKYSPAQYGVLDTHGVVKKGSRVNPKDLLVCGLVKTQVVGTDAILGRISKALARPYQEVALTWNHGTPGEVIDVVRTGSQIAVLVKTIEQMQVGDKLCYDEETEMLTDGGWKPVADVTVADRVASLVDGSDLVYVEPSATHTYVRGGRMYSLRTQQLDMLVTDSHKLWVSERYTTEFALISAKAVYGRRVRHQKDAQWRGASPTHVVLPALQVKAGQFGRGVRTIPEVRIPTRVFAGLLGAYLSEGNLLDQPESGSYGIEITQIKSPNRAEFLEWLNANAITWTPTGDKFRLHSKQLLEWFRPLGLQPERYIPQEIFQWAKEDLVELFHWLMWGDGTTKGDLPIAYYSSSRRLVDDVQRLCLHIGYAANVRQRRGAEYQTIKGKTYWCRASYEARIVSTKTRPQVNHGHTKQQSAQSEVWVEDYRKPVYGVTVPSGVVYVRRNGKPVWSGNSGRHGNKGVVAKILPDHEMLKDEAGNTIDLLLTSAGVISRINPSQVLETALGKVVEKTGKPIVFDNNMPRNLEAWTAEQLKKHNIKDKENLYDPVLKRHIKGPDGQGVFVGRQFIYKLFKSTDTNFSGHGVGPYDLNEQPLKTGGEESAKGIGKMEFDALIAHNARNFLREASAIKGQKNDEFWRAIQLGLPLPAAKSPFAFKKFVGMLEGAGLKVDQRGSKFQLLPLTDKDILARSTGEIKKPETLIAKNLKPEAGGLFDPRLTGGLGGTLYSHIDLHEPIPHPVFKEPVRRLLGLTEKGFDEKLQTHGGAWFHKELKALDTDQKLKDLHARLKTAKGADLNDTVKQIKYLDALNAHGYKPHDAYVVSKVPVVPPVFRPIIAQPNNPGELMIADANKLYMHVMDSNHTLKNTALESDIGKHRRQMFNAVAALYGTEDVENDELRGQSVKGFLSNIAGVGTPKGGFFQRKVIRKTQDVSGRGTAVPDPTLGMDNVGIPEQMLWQMYDKLIIARMVRQGHTALEAKEAVLKKTPSAKAAFMQEIGERPVMINRAPTLHRWSIVSAYAVPVQGKTIRVNPFIEKGMNLDFDGDAVFSCVYSRLSEPVYQQLTDDGHMLDSVTEADMAARLKEVVGYRTGDHIIRCNLAEFPHAEEVSKREHRTFYRVPPGVEVIALDERTGRLCFAQVSLWSVHRDLKVETVNLASGRQTITDDDPRAVYGVHPTTLEYVRARPSEAVGMFVPVGHVFTDLAGHTPVEEVSIPARYMQHDTRDRLRSRVPLTLGVGHFFGVIAGDGWAVDSAKACTQVALASIDESVASAFAKDLAEIFTAPVHLGRTDRIGGDFGPHVQSTRYVCSSMALARWVRDCVGTGARHKHLPPFFFTAPRAFRLGLLAGLLDTDGSISVSRGKKTPQWMVNFTSTSLRLCQEVVWLCRSLGVTATTSTSRTPLGDTCWQVTLSTPELHVLQEMPCAHAEKARRFSEFFRGAAPRSDLGGYTRQDSVPLPHAVGRALIARYPLETKKLTRKKDPITGDAAERIKANASVNQMLWRSSKEGSVSRYTAARCLADHPTLRESSDPLLQRWIRIVDNTDIRWDRVISFERTGIVEDGYDLTVPGYETFMNVEGVILSNTLQVHAPVTHDATSDAKKMTLSNMLLADNTRNKILAFPQHEAIIGFTHGSKLAPSNKPVRHFKSMEEAIAAYKRGELAANDPIEVS